MEMVKYIIENISKISKCCCRCMSLSGSLICPEAGQLPAEDGLCREEELFHEIFLASARDRCNLYVDDCFLYGVFSHEGHLYIIGPVALRELSASYISQYLDRRGFGKSFPVPCIFIEDFTNILSFFYGLVTGDREPLTLTTPNMQALLEQHIDQHYAAYQLENSEYDREHHSYEQELMLNDQSVKGLQKEFPREYWRAGTMAVNSTKQYEYECVCAITMITRVALRAGVLESRAYGLSDLTLQRLSIAKNTLEMKQIFEYGQNLFAKEIEAVSRQDLQNPYIKRIKNYVAKHIYEKIRLEDIAREMNLNASYLSTIFTKETGKPLSRYILEKKIEMSCNLLKYSNSSISAIAEYMQITPQNYFTKVFREIMGTTPLKYRRENKSEAFLDKNASS